VVTSTSPRRKKNNQQKQIVSPYTASAEAEAEAAHSTRTRNSNSNSTPPGEGVAAVVGITVSPPRKIFRNNRCDMKCNNISDESIVIQLCRNVQWESAWQRLKEFPEEVQPRQYTLPMISSFQPKYYYYHETALHIVCRLAQFSTTATDTATSTIATIPSIEQILLERLLKVAPQQTLVPNDEEGNGHTALRELLRNPTCTTTQLVTVLRVMMKQQSKSKSQQQHLFVQIDRDGLRPLDHILARTFAFASKSSSGEHSTINCNNTTSSAWDLLKCFVELVGVDNLILPYCPDSGVVSPLIRFLSLGNSNEIGTTSNFTTAKTPHYSQRQQEQQQQQQQQDILRITQYLLDNFPPDVLLSSDQFSCTTDCSPLHIAIRNYGNQLELIQCFLAPLFVSTTPQQQQQPEQKSSSSSSSSSSPSLLIARKKPFIVQMLQQQNHFGDLPLHVACSVGVPISVLKVILKATIKASSSSSCCQNLCWMVNKAGYTPIDLEWIRHIEDGKGLFMARSFYPIEAGCMKKSFWKQDDFYRTLLQKAVNQAIDNHHTNKKKKKTMNAKTKTTEKEKQEASVIAVNELPSQEHPQPTWELLLHRIYLILHAAATATVPSSIEDLTTGLLHAACQLSLPQGPSIPLPLLELILYLHPEQLVVVDQQHGTGNVPLHCAVDCSLISKKAAVLSAGEGDTATTSNNNNISLMDWKQWIQLLVKHSPSGCMRLNTKGQLPLHVALESFQMNGVCIDVKINSSSLWKNKHQHQQVQQQKEQQQIFWDIVVVLVEAHPESVNCVDPIYELMPFQLAAVNSWLSLDAVFYLLKRSPDAISMVGVGQSWHC